MESKNAMDELIAKQKIEIQAQRMDVQIQGGPRVEWMNWESVKNR